MSTILTVNGGSSSIKFALFATANSPRRLLSGKVERIGIADPVMSAKIADREDSVREPIDAPDHARAVAAIISWLDKNVGLKDLAGIGHRVVHGGPRLTAPQRIDAALIEELKRISPLDPLHLPSEIALIEVFLRHFPGLPQVACFDTAFHHELPVAARILPIPRSYENAGVRRYGFHGLSYTYLMGELARIDATHADGRIILAHLGAGASMAAVHHGKCIDTTMAFTPTAGLVMATRCGDVDPGLLIYLMRSEGMNADQIEDLTNRRSGLLGISEVSSDVRDLLQQEKTNPQAAEAIEIFCYSARKWIGALSAALGGLDTLVFSAGIGENSPPIRERICDGLGFLGLDLDADRNAQNAAVISNETSKVVVRVIPTDEELVIARAVAGLLAGT